MEVVSEQEVDERGLPLLVMTQCGRPQTRMEETETKMKSDDLKHPLDICISPSLPPSSPSLPSLPPSPPKFGQAVLELIDPGVVEESSGTEDVQRSPVLREEFAHQSIAALLGLRGTEINSPIGPL